MVYIPDFSSDESSMINNNGDKNIKQTIGGLNTKININPLNSRVKEKNKEGVLTARKQPLKLKRKTMKEFGIQF